MKKPKKSGAKSSAARITQGLADVPAETAESEAGAADVSKKGPVKKASKSGLKSTMTAGAAESKPVPAEGASKAKSLGGVKPGVKSKLSAAAKSGTEVQSSTSGELPIEAKSELGVKPMTKRKPAVVPKGAVEPVVEFKPPVKEKLSHKKSETTPKVARLEAQASGEVKAAAPTQEISADEPVKKAPAGSSSAESSKPAVAALATIKGKPGAASETPVKSTEPERKSAGAEGTSILPIFPDPPKRVARKAPERIPSILFEGDKPEAAVVSGPGRRYALGPTAPAEAFQTEGELPESYGTGELLLTARDPHWLYTHWDLSADQQRRYNAFSRDGHLIIRVYVDEIRAQPAVQVHVHPESRHWFVHVDKANTRYVAELGYYSAMDKWMVVATSASTLTPPDAVSAESAVEFGTIPFEVPMEKLLSLVKDAVQENAPLAQALQELRAGGHVDLPPVEVPASAMPKENGHWQGVMPVGEELGSKPEGSKRAARWVPSEWTPAQERALAEVVSMDHVRRVWMGSLEITELIRRQFVHELASMVAAELGEIAPGAPTSPAGAVTAISSPVAKAAARPAKGFWFNVNAELIVYGATEKDATVTIAGRKIKLRPDGSFSFRFALPDGNYEMPVVAVSADETDGRAADLKFSRETEYRGDVGAHPQDSSLQKMSAESF